MLVSVIVPIFKTEEFLSKCIQSVRDQTYKEIEIICVEDCSPEPSRQACVDIVQQHASEDKRIVLIQHEQNLGLGGARNTGIKRAKGTYIASVDSDDVMKPNMVEVLMHQASSGNFDVVVCGFERKNEQGAVLQYSASKRRVVFPQREDFDIFLGTNPAFWNKLWKRSLFTDNNIFFPEHLYYQDSATTPRIYSVAHSISIIDDILYEYLVRENSITTQFSDKHILDYFRVFNILSEFLNENSIYDKHEGNFHNFVHRAINHHIEMGVARITNSERKTLYVKQLLAMKQGFLSIGSASAGLQYDSILQLSSMIAEPKRLDYQFKEISCSVLVKTFIRPKHLERLLESIAKWQLAHQAYFSEVIVADDSFEDIRVENKAIIGHYRVNHPHLKIRYLKLEDNVGLSAGRNALVDAAKYDSVLLCDDDFIFDLNCNYAGAFEQFRASQMDLVGGWLKNNYNIQSGKYDYWGAHGRLDDSGSSLIISLDEREISQDSFISTEYLLNFFFAKRDVLLRHPWDNEMKIEEHQLFFLNLKHAGKRCALSGALFVKHLADREQNPKQYNDARFSKSVWEGYLRLSLSKMGIDERTILRIRKNHFARWTVSSDPFTNVQSRVDLEPSVLGLKVPVERVSEPFISQSMGGYFDADLTSKDGEYTVSQTIPAPHRLPKPGDRSHIYVHGIVGGERNLVATTAAWNHQQGSFLQVHDRGTSPSVYYNDFDETTAKFVARAVDRHGTVLQTYGRPIASIIRSGYFLSLNFSRLFDYRPGYGYPHLPDLWVEETAPVDDGIWKVDIATGKEEMIFGLDEAKKFLRSNGISVKDSSKFVFNHATPSTSGRRILLLLREFSPSAPYPSYTIVINNDGSNPKLVFGFVSHYHWRDDEVIICSGHPGSERMPLSVYEVNVVSDRAKKIAETWLKDDGHCSYNPDRSFSLYDSYSHKAFPYRRLQVVRLSDRRVVDLGFFFSPGKWYNNNNDLRCDLHPRWSADGTYITFDSIHEGFRGVYRIQIDDISRYLESTEDYIEVASSYVRDTYIALKNASSKSTALEGALSLSRSSGSESFFSRPSVRNRAKSLYRFMLGYSLLRPFAHRLSWLYKQKLE